MSEECIFILNTIIVVCQTSNMMLKWSYRPLWIHCSAAGFGGVRDCAATPESRWRFPPADISAQVEIPCSWTSRSSFCRKYNFTLYTPFCNLPAGLDLGRNLRPRADICYALQVSALGAKRTCAFPPATGKWGTQSEIEPVSTPPTPKKGILQKSNGDFPQKFEYWFRI